MIATAPQVRYIKDLFTRKLFAADAAVAHDREARLVTVLQRHQDGVEPMTKAFASACIDWLIGCPNRPTATAPTPVPIVAVEPLTPGVYRRDGEVYLVKPSKAGKLYAKRLVPIGGERLTQGGEVVKFEFDYAPGVVGSLTVADRLPLAEAEKLMLAYGRCICCNRPLKAAASVGVGIGPVCRKLFA